MTSTRIKARPAWWMGMIGAGVLVAPGLAHAQPLDLLYERAVMQAANARCALFAPELGDALASAAAQAKGAALRAGASAEQVEATERAARSKAGAVDCRSKDMTIAAERVRNAFAGYARISRLTYPGDVAAWHADRESRLSPWRLKQDAAFGPDSMSFGLAGRGGGEALIAAARFSDGATPYSARLLMRDSGRTTGPYLERASTGPTAGLPLTKRLPTRGALKGFVAEARESAGADLLGKGERGWAFRFPAAAAGALAALDPREAVIVEFQFSDGVRRAYVEVGDFAAGQAFLRLAAR